MRRLSTGYEGNIFEQVPDAKVPIGGLRELRKYLTEHITTWNGEKVLGFVSFGAMMYVRTERDGLYRKRFYGFVDDVAHNVQKGFYEEVS